MTRNELITKIAQDTYHIRVVVESCQTIEQVENTNKWACSMIDKWNHMRDKDWSILEYSDIWEYIDRASRDLTNFIDDARNRVGIKNNTNTIRQYYLD
jgi:hypothetical protein